MTGEIPGLSRDELEDQQLERLRETLRRVHRHVPHYRQAFAEAGVHPDDLTSLADLRHFPFTTKADLRANYPYGVFAVPREHRSEIMVRTARSLGDCVAGRHGEVSAVREYREALASA